MSTVSLKDAKASFSNVIDQAAAGEFVTITRHGRAAAVIVSVGAAEAARKALAKDRPSLVQYLKTFPADIDADDDVFARNPAPSREADL
jgi:prevent-host-death family protein